MKRCPNGTRRNKNGDCVRKNDKHTLTSVKRCPNGTRRNKNGDCVKSSAKNHDQKKSSSLKNNLYEYIITVHNSNGDLITDMDYPIGKAEKQLKINIGPLSDRYISKYKTLMNNSNIDKTSLWYCKTDKKLSSSYNINYNNKKYIFKFLEL